MSVREETITSAESQRPFARLEHGLTRLIYLDGEKIAYLVIFALAVLSRFWDLGARVMSHDESLHTRYSWGLYRGEGFAHTPLMHGPLLFHMTALSYLLFGDNDFTSRIYPAVVGVIVVLMPGLMRRWLGRMGALAASFFFLISPLILYYSRYIRHDLPAILAALVMAVAIWRYMEDRQFKYLVWLGGAQAVLFASKEVSFIYIAIFGSFLLLYFIVRLLDVEWSNALWRTVFAVALIVGLVVLSFLGLLIYEHGYFAEVVLGTEATAPADHVPPTPGPVSEFLLGIPVVAVAGVLGVVVAVLGGAVLIGQWRNLRRFPELDLMVAMGTLILPMLTPLLIVAAGYDPVDESAAGVTRSILFTLPVLTTSILIGLAYFMKPPEPRLLPAAAVFELADRGAPLRGGGVDFPDEAPAERVEVPPDLLDWMQAFLASRWWTIGGVYWAIFVFFFTTMFTNGAGLGTGIIGSLGYWLAQQEVKRGGQPWYYYLVVLLPIYEFLPVLLSLAAGVVGLGTLLRPAVENVRAVLRPPSDESDPTLGGEGQAAGRRLIDLDAPIRFPVLPFIAYWVILNLIAYSVAGEKMPWLTTHLTTPMILLGGWVVGRTLERINWRRLWDTTAWVLFFLIPVLVVALLRVTAPLCRFTPGNLLCNTVVPVSYQSGVFGGRTTAALASTGVWMAALIVLAGVLVSVIVAVRRVGAGQVARVASLCLVGWLAFLTARAAWRAAYITYDEATEYLVYAHSAGSVKEVMDQIEEISLKTTDGYGLRVAYDNRVSWPFSWYLRNYYNAVYYADQPSRGLIGDAPVILAGPDNWVKVEPLLGDRYYQFEYIRMWWPMQDYFNLNGEKIRNFFRDPALQRGVWDIFYRRDYTAYGEAVGRSFELSQWTPAERMRLYIRRDVFAQVWDYGVAAGDIAEALDPYAANSRDVLPELSFGAGILNRPHGIAMGPDGNLYVADTNNHRIAVFGPDGNFIRAFGTHGFAPQPGVLNEPWGVAVSPDGRVYVADTWNHRIVTFTLEGEYINNWGFEGPNVLDDPLAFWGPRDVTVDQDGMVYVADTGNKRIQVFDSEDFFVRQIGSGGAQIGQLDEPVGLAIGPDGNLYVADTWNQRIEVFTPDGVFIREWYVDAWFAQTNERPYLDVDAQGNVYVTDPDAYRVIVFTGTGEYLYSFGDATVFGLAGAVLADDEGHLFVVDTGQGLIHRFNLRELEQPPSAP